MSIILPGEHVPARHVNLKLGPGLLQLSSPDKRRGIADEGLGIISTKAGTLHHSTNQSKWWIENNSRRYVPAQQESVIGVIILRSGEGFRVDIGSAHTASLDGLAFEGATKRNKPNLKVWTNSIETRLYYLLNTRVDRLSSLCKSVAGSQRHGA
ncbi:exosome non-catalytic core subunit rrp40, variant 3 [Pleurotus ostreatus]|nr:exosome non-catalytic core subunit rrp40, variant 3 [Pleurotus ostreatus]